MTERAKAPTREEVLATQLKRWEFLLHLYNVRSQSKPGRILSVNAFEVAKAIGIDDRGEADRTFSYLQDAGLINYETMGPTVTITKYGIDTVEEAIAVPDKRTEHFLPMNVIHIAGSVHGSQFQQGTSSSSQTVTITQATRTDLLTLLPELRAVVEQLSGQERASAGADLQTVEQQANSPTPRAGVIRECLVSLRTVAEKSGAAVLAAKITAMMQATGWL